MRASALVVLLVLASPFPASAQTTPWGDPDLQGIWSNQTPTPLERPDALAGKEFFTEAEAAEFERTALPRLLAILGPEAVALSGELNAIWLETQHGQVPLSRRTSLIVDPADGKVPFTVSGRKRWDATPKIGSEALPADRPEDRTLAERCITTDGLLLPNPFYNNYYEIVQAPGYVVIVTEMMHEARVIPIDGRAPLGDGVRAWRGESRGRWEGRTLVVETTNFNDKLLFQGSTKNLRLVERFSRRDADTIDYQLTVSDPDTFTRPWTLENPLRRAGGGIYEVACHEGNIGLRAILSGARAEEQRGRANRDAGAQATGLPAPPASRDPR